MQVSITSEQSSQPWPLSCDANVPTGFIRESGRYLIAYEGAPGFVPSLCIGDEAVAVTRTVDRASGIRIEAHVPVPLHADAAGVGLGRELLCGRSSAGAQAR